MSKHTSQPESTGPIDQWKRSLTLQAASRDKELSNTAWNRRLTLLNNFSEFAGKSHDELLAQNPMDTHEQLMEWFAEIRKDLSFNSARTHIAYVRGFFSHNGIGFPKGCRLPNAKASKVVKTYNDTDVWEISDEGEVHGFNNLLPQFLSNLSFREKTVALCLLTSGQDTKDLLELNVDFVKDGNRIYWEGERQKDGISFKTFISKEATEMLRLYVEQERAGTSGQDPLFVNRDGNRLEVQDVRNAFAYAAKKMGINGDNGNPFRPKRFRHIFRTAFSHARVDQGFANAFMGHKTSVSDSYLNKSRAQLTAAYSEVERYLTVFGTNGDLGLSEIREDLENKVKVLRGELVDRDKRVDKLESEVKWMREFIDSLIEGVEGKPIEEVLRDFKSEESQ